MNYKDLIIEDIRLVILRCLEEDAGYALNESVLASIMPVFGHHISRDSIRTELQWLAEQGLVTVEDVMSVSVASITKRGVDVARGTAIVPGVKRPGPRG